MITTAEHDVFFIDLRDLAQKLSIGQCRLALNEIYLSDFEDIFKLNRSWSKVLLSSVGTNSILVNSRNGLYNLIRNSTSCVIGLDLVPNGKKLCGIVQRTFPSEIPVTQYVYLHKL